MIVQWQISIRIVPVAAIADFDYCPYTVRTRIGQEALLADAFTVILRSQAQQLRKRRLQKHYCHGRYPTVSRSQPDEIPQGDRTCIGLMTDLYRT